MNQIAVTYAQMGQPKKAIDIYRQLLKYVQKHYSNGMSRYAGKFALVACNYTNVLFMVGRYDDALEVAELGRKLCVEYPTINFCPEFWISWVDVISIRAIWTNARNTIEMRTVSIK